MDNDEGTKSNYAKSRASRLLKSLQRLQGQQAASGPFEVWHRAKGEMLLQSAPSRVWFRTVARQHVLSTRRDDARLIWPEEKGASCRDRCSTTGSDVLSRSCDRVRCASQKRSTARWWCRLMAYLRGAGDVGIHANNNTSKVQQIQRL